MIKIWGKIINQDRIMKHKTIEIDEKKSSFFDMLKEMCQTLNIPTPVLLDKHVYDFNLFHVCFFKPEDFVEEVKFEKLSIQLISD